MDGFRIVAQPDGTSVQLGGVSQHANLIEHPRLAADRIVRLHVWLAGTTWSPAPTAPFRRDRFSAASTPRLCGPSLRRR
jgi:hypothetical protein